MEQPRVGLEVWLIPALPDRSAAHQQLTHQRQTQTQTSTQPKPSRQHAIATRAAAASTPSTPTAFTSARRRQQLCMMAANGNGGAPGTVAVCFDFDGTLGAYGMCVCTCICMCTGMRALSAHQSDHHDAQPKMPPPPTPLTTQSTPHAPKCLPACIGDTETPAMEVAFWEAAPYIPGLPIGTSTHAIGCLEACVCMLVYRGWWDRIQRSRRCISLARTTPWRDTTRQTTRPPSTPSSPLSSRQVPTYRHTHIYTPYIYLHKTYTHTYACMRACGHV